MQADEEEDDGADNDLLIVRWVCEGFFCVCINRLWWFSRTDMIFVKDFTRPDFLEPKFYTKSA